MAQRGPLVGAFSGTGASPEVLASQREYNISLWGGSGVVTIERSFDGITWNPIETFSESAERILDNVEVDTRYRFNCISLSSGPLNYRLGARSI